MDNWVVKRYYEWVDGWVWEEKINKRWVVWMGNINKIWIIEWTKSTSDVLLNYIIR